MSVNIRPLICGPFQVQTNLENWKTEHCTTQPENEILPPERERRREKWDWFHLLNRGLKSLGPKTFKKVLLQRNSRWQAAEGEKRELGVSAWFNQTKNLFQISKFSNHFFFSKLCTPFKRGFLWKNFYYIQ